MASERAYSTKYEDHKALVAMLARRYYRRLLAGKITSVDEEDVESELRVAFVKAARGYNREAGWTFTAFAGRCMQNHFNAWADKLFKEQYGANVSDPAEYLPGGSGLGYVSVQDIPTVDGGDLYEILADDNAPDPSMRLFAEQQLDEVMADETLLPHTRVYVSLLIDPSQQVGEEGRAALRSRFSEVRAQVMDRWGVDLGRFAL